MIVICTTSPPPCNIPLLEHGHRKTRRSACSRGPPVLGMFFFPALASVHLVLEIIRTHRDSRRGGVQVEVTWARVRHSPARENPCRKLLGGALGESILAGPESPNGFSYDDRFQEKVTFSGSDTPINQQGGTSTFTRHVEMLTSDSIALYSNIDPSRASSTSSQAKIEQAFWKTILEGGKRVFTYRNLQQHRSNIHLHSKRRDVVTMSGLSSRSEGYRGNSEDALQFGQKKYHLYNFPASTSRAAYIHHPPSQNYKLSPYLGTQRMEEKREEKEEKREEMKEEKWGPTTEVVKKEKKVEKKEEKTEEKKGPAKEDEKKEKVEKDIRARIETIESFLSMVFPDWKKVGEIPDLILKVVLNARPSPAEPTAIDTRSVGGTEDNPYKSVADKPTLNKPNNRYKTIADKPIADKPILNKPSFNKPISNGNYVESAIPKSVDSILKQYNYSLLYGTHTEFNPSGIWVVQDCYNDMDE